MLPALAMYRVGVRSLAVWWDNQHGLPLRCPPLLQLFSVGVTDSRPLERVHMLLTWLTTITASPVVLTCLVHPASCPA
jgi:hypothetical protein